MNNIQILELKLEELIEFNIILDYNLNYNYILIKKASNLIYLNLIDIISLIKISNKKIYILFKTNKKTIILIKSFLTTLNNILKGLNKPFCIKLNLIGLGYYIIKDKQYLNFKLGYNHNIKINIPREINITIKNNNTLLILESFNKFLLGFISSKIRKLQLPDSYKGKGISYTSEKLKLKTKKSKI